MPTARASVSDYSWSAGRRQQPLVNFNEIKTCPALCLGSSLFIFMCVEMCVCLLEECCSAATTLTSQTQHKQNNVMYKRRMSNLITSHLYSLWYFYAYSSASTMFVQYTVDVWLICKCAMLLLQQTLTADIIAMLLCICVKNWMCVRP